MNRPLETYWAEDTLLETEILLREVRRRAYGAELGAPVAAVRAAIDELRAGLGDGRVTAIEALGRARAVRDAARALYEDWIRA